MWPSPYPFRNAKGVGLVLALFAFAACVLLYLPESFSLPSLPLLHQAPLPCPQDPTADRVMVVVKTGATVASERIPTLMKTTLRCVKHTTLFSDMEQDIDQYHLYDALDAVTPTVKQGSDFDFYRQQQKVWAESHNVSSLKGTKTANSNDLAAWTLDKYKNIHIVEKIWKLNPVMEWYVFIDADTYLVWPTLLRWLSGLDASKKWWLGSIACRGNLAFTHGGSGYILSKSTVEDLVVLHNDTAARYDPEIPAECCGDVMLARALTDIGIHLSNVWPSISGQKPANMPFLDENWCQPTLTLHHLTPAEMVELHDYELGRSNKSIPLTHSELFSGLVLGAIQNITAPRRDWDNTEAYTRDLASAWSENEQLKQTKTFQDCVRACEDFSACLQYTFDGSSCYLSRTVRLGESRKPNGERRFTSGWHQPRIVAWSWRQKKCNAHELPIPLVREGFNC